MEHPQSKKRVVMVGRMKKDGSEFRADVDLAFVREKIYEEAPNAPTRSGRLSIRQLDRVHAKTGAPWYLIAEEAARLGM